MTSLKKKISFAFLSMLAISGLSTLFAQSQPPVVHPPQPTRRIAIDENDPGLPRVQLTIPEGTPLAVRPVETISSTTHATGAIFEAILDQDVTVEDRVVLPRGTRVFGEVTDAIRGGKVKGRAEMTVVLREIEVEGVRHALETNPITVVAQGNKAKEARNVGIAAGIGAVIGAIAGGGKGAAIGATIGAGAQTARVLTSRGEAAEIEKERLISFRLEKPLVID